MHYSARLQRNLIIAAMALLVVGFGLLQFHGFEFNGLGVVVVAAATGSGSLQVRNSSRIADRLDRQDERLDRQDETIAYNTEVLAEHGRGQARHSAQLDQQQSEQRRFQATVLRCERYIMRCVGQDWPEPPSGPQTLPGFN